MGDYRPISLCSVAYKLISKVLGLRIQRCLDVNISESQAAFAPGRQISDNILVAHELINALKSKKDCSEKYMAIKTDFSKAYDRVEWSFLEAIMFKLGFHTICISWIMSCVKYVTYSVLINGIPYGEIKPSRGIRQDDTLSPYLFLIYAEALSQMIDKAQRENKFQGMKLARRCPSVSHLFYADDSLFFCKANEENASCMADILVKYEKASGQKVNLEKSSIIVGARIDSQRRTQIQNILNIHVTGGGGKYLGLPEQFGRSKVKEFEGIVQKIKAITSQWHNQFLSQAGKEVLIKSVLQAKPVYPMSCFLIPKTTCDEINAILSEFWWGKGDERRKISWVSWQRLCLPKKECGMGFRDLYSFNKALLAKQAWRIWQNPNSFLSRIYKGRYHHSLDFLQSSNVKHASYGYKSIQLGKELLQQGLRVRIGDGKNTNVVLPNSGPQQQIVKSSKWEPPPIGWIKCNFDYSFVSEDTMDGVGLILRDELGRFLGAGSIQVQSMQTSLEGEALSFLIALQQVWVRGFQRVWFEGDSKELCTIINQVKEHVELGNLLCDIRHWIQLLLECSLDFVNRENNQAVDAIAKNAIHQNISGLFYHFPPVWLINFLYHPFFFFCH